MSLFSVQARKHTAYYDHLMSTSTSRTPVRERQAERKSSETTEITPGDSACEDSRLSDKSRQINRTYVISTLSKSGGGQQTTYRARLTLQRRSRRKTGAEAVEKTMGERSQTVTPAAERRLTVQRKTRTQSADQSTQGQRGVHGTDPNPVPKVLGEPNGRTPSLFRSTSLRETPSGNKSGKTTVPVDHPRRLVHSKTPSTSSSSSTSTQPEVKAHTFSTPTKKTPFEKIAAKRDVFERLAGREAPKPVTTVKKSASLERPQKQHEDTKPVAAPRVSKAPAGVHKLNTGLQPKTASSVLTPGPRGDATLTGASPPAPQPGPTEPTLSRPSEALRQQDVLKMENSAVTVAVRVRPFNARSVSHCLTEGCVCLTGIWLNKTFC